MHTIATLAHQLITRSVQHSNALRRSWPSRKSSRLSTPSLNRPMCLSPYQRYVCFLLNPKTESAILNSHEQSSSKSQNHSASTHRPAAVSTAATAVVTIRRWSLATVARAVIVPFAKWRHCRPGPCRQSRQSARDRCRSTIPTRQRGVLADAVVHPHQSWQWTRIWVWVAHPKVWVMTRGRRRHSQSLTWWMVLSHSYWVDYVNIPKQIYTLKTRIKVLPPENKLSRANAQHQLGSELLHQKVNHNQRSRYQARCQATEYQAARYENSTGASCQPEGSLMLML